MPQVHDDVIHTCTDHAELLLVDLPRAAHRIIQVGSFLAWYGTMFERAEEIDFRLVVTVQLDHLLVMTGVHHNDQIGGSNVIFRQAAGAMLGEWWKGSDWDTTWQIGQAAFWGRLFGTLGKITLGSAILVIVLAALLIK